MNNDHSGGITGRRIILALFFGTLLALGFVILHNFLVPLAWAAILAYVTWPAYARLRRVMPGRPGLSALVMTLVMTVAAVGPLLWVIIVLRSELAGVWGSWEGHVPRIDQMLPPFIRDIPWLGTELERFLRRLEDPAARRAQLSNWWEAWGSQAAGLVGGIGRNATKFGLALITLFFVYRDGEKLLTQIRAVLLRFLGGGVNDYLGAAGATTKAVVYGIVLTALAQGTLAGLGYWFVGLNSPVLLGALTAVIALIPFGTPFVWGAISLWLFIKGDTVAGAALAAWGILVVSWVDNLIRPLVISNATHIPFLLVLFGVLGGLTAFGLIGLFIGPVVLAVLLAIWREWSEEAQEHMPPPPPAP